MGSSSQYPGIAPGPSVVRDADLVIGIWSVGDYSKHAHKRPAIEQTLIPPNGLMQADSDRAELLVDAYGGVGACSVIEGSTIDTFISKYVRIIEHQLP